MVQTKVLQIIKVITGKSGVTTEWLRKWNLALGIVTALEGLALLLFSVPFMAPISVSFLTVDTLETHVSGKTVSAPGLQQIATFNVVYLVAAALFILAITYLASATIYRIQYESLIRKAQNPIRWTGQVISIALLVVAFGEVIGINDIYDVVTLGISTLIIGGLTMAAEAFLPIGKRQQFGSRLLPAVILIAIVLLWVQLTMRILATIIYGHEREPIVVLSMYAVIIVMICGFAVIQFLRYARKHAWRNYMYGEWTGMLLGFIAASVLTWLLYGGILHG